MFKSANYSIQVNVLSMFYRISDAPSEMTDAVDTTTPMLTTKSLQTTRDEETRPTEIMLLSTKIIESSTSPSVTQNISQSKTTIGPPKVEIVTTPSTVVIRNTTLRSTVTGVLVTTVRTKAPFITIDDVDTLKHDYNETQGKICSVANISRVFTC